MTRLEIAHRLAVFAVYSLLFGYLGRVVYLISERLWVTVRRWVDHYRVQKAFELDMDSGFIAEHNARQRLGPVFDTPQLIEAMKAEMFPKRNVPEYEDIDADYSALTTYYDVEPPRAA